MNDGQQSSYSRLPSPRQDTTSFTHKHTHKRPKVSWVEIFVEPNFIKSRNILATISDYFDTGHSIPFNQSFSNNYLPTFWARKRKLLKFVWPKKKAAILPRRHMKYSTHYLVLPLANRGVTNFFFPADISTNQLNKPNSEENDSSIFILVAAKGAHKRQATATVNLRDLPWETVKDLSTSR